MSRSITGAIAAVAAGAVLVSGCSSSKTTVDPPHSGATSSTASGPSDVSFNGVTLTGASDLAKKPTVQAKSATKPTELQIKDVVTGDGPAASPTSTVTVQYIGVKYADGKQFDASWDHGGATSFSLQRVVPGFTQGIGGNGTVPPMKVGGRRVMILPAALGYGSAGTPDGTIGPNTPLVFVVDLVGVS